ncbi:type VII secretion protein EccB [Nocardia sp. CDC160]|uniref:type VII secretion protein EccB n=1 Tax=Nocardia sp. CDC160 TaxID=3112166 RepID=UPI002DBAFD18|nr:type VII secretion protein EccB [Nocardia sp. CDC160]MEC3920211.1 type VII secretion protein EccB [Nocardia sp. CDC160]
MARFRVVTKHQISGWRFLLRRIEHALIHRDASMIDDPQRGRSTALSVGLALACLVLAGSAVLAFFKPAKQIGDSRIVAEKDTGALYVHIGDRLYPALNLTSARLIVGSPDDPVPVSSDELAKYPHGPLVGIPGAPLAIVDSGDRNSSWAVCDTTRTGAAAPVNPQTGLPTIVHPAVLTTAIGSPLIVNGSTTRPLAVDEARLLRDDTTTWLVYVDHDGEIVRAAVDLADSAVTLALGIDATSPVSPASKGLLDAIPETPPIHVPDVPGAGSTMTLASGMPVNVGTVVTTATPDHGQSYYVASQSGFVQVSPVLAAIFRNADSHGAAAAMSVRPDVIAADLRPGNWPGTATFPTRQVRIVNPDEFGITCYTWANNGDQHAVTGLLVGRQLPLPSEDQNRVVNLVTASTSHGNTADAAFMARGTGRFVQVTGADPSSPLRESLYWISDSGVRYGIDAQAQSSGDATLTALALHSPVSAPWSIVSLFAIGPALSQRDARVAHDGLPPDKVVVGLGGGS